MKPIPESWPPEEDWDKPTIVPLFPLPNVFLFPGCIMPLHVFEERYRQMVADLLDGPGRMVIGTVLEPDSQDLSGSPPVLPVAGLGEIGRHEQLPDGRFLIWLIGLARTRIEEVESDRLYRKVKIEILNEEPIGNEENKALRPNLKRAILERLYPTEKENIRTKLHPKIPTGHLVDLLLQSMQIPQSMMQGFYSELSVRARAAAALSEHAKRPIEKKPEEDEEGESD